MSKPKIIIIAFYFKIEPSFCILDVSDMIELARSSLCVYQSVMELKFYFNRALNDDCVLSGKHNLNGESLIQRQWEISRMYLTQLLHLGCFSCDSIGKIFPLCVAKYLPDCFAGIIIKSLKWYL